MKIAVIVPAAGIGKRFGAQGGDTRSKIEMPLGDRPVFLRSLELFFRRPQVKQIILAVNPAQLQEFKLRYGDKLGFHGVEVVAGGTIERWETVLKALDVVEDDCTHVAIHDAARPLASAALIDRVFAAAEKHPAVIPAVPVSATLKRVAPLENQQEADPLDAILGSAGKETLHIQRVTGAVDRANVVEVQTPQVFERNLLAAAYRQITDGVVSGKGITDDAGLVERLGQTIYVVDGESTNFKITRPEDMQLAEGLATLRDQQSSASLAKRRLFGDDDED